MSRSRREQEAEPIVPSITGKVYNHSKRMKKRAVLDDVAAELRRISKHPVKAAAPKPRLAARSTQTSKFWKCEQPGGVKQAGSFYFEIG
jgi:hypothetical protein